MNTKKEVLTVEQVKDLLNDYVKSFYIGNIDCNHLELSSQDALYKAQSLIKVCQGAL